MGGSDAFDIIDVLFDGPFEEIYIDIPPGKKKEKR